MQFAKHSPNRLLSNANLNNFKNYYFRVVYTILKKWDVQPPYLFKPFKQIVVRTITTKNTAVYKSVTYLPTKTGYIKIIYTGIIHNCQHTYYVWAKNSHIVHLSICFFMLTRFSKIGKRTPICFHNFDPLRKVFRPNMAVETVFYKQRSRCFLRNKQLLSADAVAARKLLWSLKFRQYVVIIVLDFTRTYEDS